MNETRRKKAVTYMSLFKTSITEKLYWSKTMGHRKLMLSNFFATFQRVSDLFPLGPSFQGVV